MRSTETLMRFVIAFYSFIRGLAKLDIAFTIHDFGRTNVSLNRSQFKALCTQQLNPH